MASQYSPSNSTYSVSNETSPSSLFLHDLDGELFEELMMGKEDVSATMGSALGHLERITEHLREKDENEAANSIAKATISILNIFNDATADWDIEKCLMNPPSLVGGVPAGTDKPTHFQNGVTLGEAVKKIKAGSWAAVAATPTADGNRVVKFRPSDALKRHIVEDSTPVDPSLLRVVWVKHWDISRRPLSSLTEYIDQGPLLSMAYSEQDKAVCIIFMHALHARNFLQASANCAGRYGHSIFGGDVEVLEGQPYPDDEAIQRMENPWNERRRLTFARQKLFAEGTTEEQFKKDIFAIVGEHNVELVWLFNSGNATVVFSATAIARMVRDEFRKRARQPGPYRDVQVSFSHDPCERPLNLITQIPSSSSRNGVRSSNGSSTSHSFPRPSAPTSPRRRPSGTRVDEDGWQTVGKRK